MLAHRAGVDHDDIGVFRIVRRLVAHLAQHARDALGVRLVLLTAEGLTVKVRRIRPNREQMLNLIDAVPLVRNLLL